MKKIIIITILVVASFIFPVSRTYAQSCGTKDDCQQLISQYEQKLSSIREQKNTLSSQINFMDTQIYLTGLKI
ncbi:MAG TPA: hypothetical protein VK338_02710, partial [Candidatus Nitrosocosmicus sp.]|nr:hypothetical protein [Candidatus Nitrosocosmicus sp.]